MSELKTFLRSGFAALYAVTSEESRALFEVHASCKEVGFEMWQWSPSNGVTGPGKSIESIKMGEGEAARPKSTTDLAIALEVFMQCTSSSDGKKLDPQLIPRKSVFVLMDAHLYLKRTDQPETIRLIRRIKDAIAVGRRTSRSLMIMACSMGLPPELEKEFTEVDFPLPGREILKEIAVRLAKGKGQELNGETEPIIDAGIGLTSLEFADAVAASLTDHGKIVPSVVAEIKEKTLKKGGLLEIIKPGVTFDNLGGMHGVRSWITKRKGAFSGKARAYGLPMPKGVLLLGVPGSGKSFVTRAIAHELGCPHISLDIGRLFAGLVGSSEANVRRVIAQIEAFGKCVVRIDEIEKAMAGMSSGDGDNGVSRRVLGSFLTWMAEKTSPVFIVATANDVTSLPPELLRKGRWDEMFFVDLPSEAERVEIWRVQLKVVRPGQVAVRNPDSFDLKALAAATPGWTGAEIEALVTEGLYAAFSDSDGEKEPTTEQLIELSKQTMPLSKTMGERIKGLQQWAKGRCRMANEEAA